MAEAPAPLAGRRTGQAFRRVLLLAILGPALLGADPATEVIVSVSSVRFDPAKVEISRGMRVSFHRRDPSPDAYAIQAVDGSFESWPLENYSQWSHRFTEPGVFEYFLREHPEVRGTVTVK